MSPQLLSEVRSQEKHKLPSYSVEDDRKFLLIFISIYFKITPNDLTTCQVAMTSTG